MVSSKAETVEEYLAELPDDRREAIEAVRQTVLDHLPDGYVEAMNWGMIAYEVPLDTFAETYNGKPLMYAALASQKNHMALYLSAVYARDEDRQWFIDNYKATGKKLDMGKSCVRFKTLEQLPLDLVAEAVGRTPGEDFIGIHEAGRA